MAVTLIGGTGLFDYLGRHFFALQTLNTARLTTVPTQVNDLITQMDGLSSDLRVTVANIAAARESWEAQGNSLAAAIVKSAGDLIIQMVKADNPQEDPSLKTALVELIRQMIVTADDVDASTVAVTPTMGSANSGTGTCIASTKRGDGFINENIYGESIEGEAIGNGSTFTFRGETTLSPKTSHDWPKGSGCVASVTASALGNLLSNAGFEDSDTNQSTKPDKWIIAVGTLGTLVAMTNVEQQTITITGTATGGSYTLTWVNAASKSQTTIPLAYNATASDVQAALNALAGLESLTVSSTGTSPDYVHTVIFYGVTNPAQLTSTNALTGGSSPALAHATSVAGSANVHSGARSLEFNSDGAELSQLRQKVTLVRETVYAFNLYAKVDSVPAAGVITVDLFDGSAVINDQQGTANSFTIDCTALTTSFVAKNGFFRTPTVLPPIVYLRIHISTAVSNTTSVFIDHCCLQKATELYAGGPFAAIFQGNTNFAAEDTITIAATNDRAGAFQEWFERAFEMRANGLLLPSDTGGTETVADSLIA